MTDVLIKTTLT